MKWLVMSIAVLLAPTPLAVGDPCANSEMVNGIRVVESGPANAPVLVLLHGVASSLETWDGWATRLSKSFRVVRLDLPGSGCSKRPFPDDPTIDGDLAIVRRVLAAKGITSYFVAGNSRGGWLAWLLAAEAPTEVRKLILIDPIGLDAAPGAADRLPPFIRLIKRHWMPRWTVAITVRGIYKHKVPTPEVIDRYWRMGLRDDNRGAVDARTTPANFIDHTSMLGTIDQPTLILWGREDHYLAAADACRFHHAIKGSQLVVLPALGHIPMEVDPETTAALAADFLNGHPLSLPAGARADCYDMRPSARIAFPGQHGEGNMTADELATRRVVAQFDVETDPLPRGEVISILMVKRSSSSARVGRRFSCFNELPGLTKYTFQLADDLKNRGYTVYLPALTGDPGLRHPMKNFAIVAGPRVAWTPPLEDTANCELNTTASSGYS